jgi:hypothetical protein
LHLFICVVSDFFRAISKKGKEMTLRQSFLSSNAARFALAAGIFLLFLVAQAHGYDHEAATEATTYGLKPLWQTVLDLVTSVPGTLFAFFIFALSIMFLVQAKYLFGILLFLLSFTIGVVPRLAEQASGLII